MLGADYSQKDFSFVATGDSLIFQKISIFDEPDFIRVREIVKKADAAFNMGIIFTDLVDCDGGAGLSLSLCQHWFYF